MSAGQTTDWIDAALDAIERAGRSRHTVAVTPRSAVEVEVDGRRLRLFSSNDYLGLSSHPAVREAVASAALAYGMGPRGASLVCGYTDAHAELEARLAALKGAEAALLFPTGYSANLAVLGALGSPETEIFSDELNHASIVDGCRLSRAKVTIYRHCDADHLESLVRASGARRRVVVTDSLFSMEGDRAPLRDLAEIRRRTGCLLVTDEAHATLVFGDGGGGLAEELGVSADVDCQVGTLSKAVGTLGGFVASSDRLRRLLLNTARPYIFTTALPAPVVAGALAALDAARSEPGLRDRLWARVEQLGLALGRELQSPIAPVVFGEERRAVEASRRLLAAGFHVTAIRPPTVPPGTSRLRIALSAAHSSQDVADLASALALL